MSKYEQLMDILAKQREIVACRAALMDFYDIYKHKIEGLWDYIQIELNAYEHTYDLLSEAYKKIKENEEK